jgi:hypothetical protein
MSNKRVSIGGRRYMSGRGMGSVLLNKGGAGGASGYESIGDYTATTGVDPFGRATGQGLGSMSKKLEELTIKPRKRKEKNINFNI